MSASTRRAAGRVSEAAVHELPERRAMHVLRDKQEVVAGGFEVIDGDHVGVAHPLQRLGLCRVAGKEAPVVAPDSEDLLHDDVPVASNLASQVDRPHGALAERLGELVAG